LVAVCAVLPAAARGGNLVRNGDFANDVAEWTVEEPEHAILEWSAADAGGSASSGSALVRNVHTGPGQGTGIEQCAGAVVAGASYTFSGKIRLATGQTRTGSARIGLRWHTEPNCAGPNIPSPQPLAEVETPSDSFVLVSSSGNVAPPGAVSALFQAFPSKVDPGGELRAEFDDLRFELEGCAGGPTVLCLNGGRFRVSMTFATATGQSGDAQAVSLTGDTGYFWFFSAGNVESVVKVLDGCDFNQRFWVFAGGLTDVRAVLSVADTQTSEVRTYSNPLGTAFRPIQDTAAFATCP
jgi:hypothetical protein